MDPVIIAFSIALAEGLFWVGKKLVESGFEAALEPAKERLKQGLPAGYRQAADNKKLLEAVRAALEKVEAPVKDEDELLAWFKQTGLARLQVKGNHALRRQVARGLLGFTDPKAEPPKDLLIALGWPRNREKDLAQLLAALRSGLAGLAEWKDLLAYADSAEQLHLLRQILSQLSNLDNLVIRTEAGEALRVVVQQQGLSLAEAAQIEEQYRDELVHDLYWHDFRGILQMKKDIRLPLAEIYQELSLLGMGNEEERRKSQERLLEMREAERVAEEERRMEQHLTDVLGRAQRLVILGEPGSGKTMSLRFIALMLAYGYGSARLGLEQPYLPLIVRAADYARDLEAQPALSLDNYLSQYIQLAYASAPRRSDFLRLALDQGACIIMFDGLDEVGGDPPSGLPLRTRVVQRLQQFADRWCSQERGNRLLVTSRIEGYWAEALRKFEHAQLSPLRPPEEVEEFLLRWFTAHEQAHEPDVPLETAQSRAQNKVSVLLPNIMNWTSVRRLSTNPLLLTILALIHENVGRLPNRRIKLYEICAQTLIESWRQAQTGLPDKLLAELGEESVVKVMAPLAYWLHEEKPGGTASYEEWQARLKVILEQEGFEREAQELADRFMHHARYQAGLLAERGLGQFGFFHLTFEEYLAARQIARQRAEERRELLKKHWEDPRWQEVILLAAGQLGIAESRTDDLNDFIEDLLRMEPASAESLGKPALLAGRAVADIGLRNLANATRRYLLHALQEAMQDLDPDRGEPNEPGKVSLRTRADSADVLDELGWLPLDLYSFTLISLGAGRAASNQVPPSPELAPFWMAIYPVTNAQYDRFLGAEDFADPGLWSGFPRYDENGKEMEKDWGDAGYGWLQERLQNREYSPDGKRVYPRFWSDPRFGAGRRGAPVVGVTWFEASAYCRWLLRHWDDLDEGRSNPILRPALVRLPTEAEWVLTAGGVDPEGRYPWDAPGKVTQEQAKITLRANVDESGLRRTTQVSMHPLGRSQPYGLWDLAGNVWEWQANFSSRDHGFLALRGGSWLDDLRLARVAARLYNRPDLAWIDIGFRVVVLPR